MRHLRARVRICEWRICPPFNDVCAANAAASNYAHICEAENRRRRRRRRLWQEITLSFDISNASTVISFGGSLPFHSFLFRHFRRSVCQLIKFPSRQPNAKWRSRLRSAVFIVSNFVFSGDVETDCCRHRRMPIESRSASAKNAPMPVDTGARLVFQPPWQ